MSEHMQIYPGALPGTIKYAQKLCKATAITLHIIYIQTDTDQASPGRVNIYIYVCVSLFITDLGCESERSTDGTLGHSYKWNIEIYLFQYCPIIQVYFPVHRSLRVFFLPRVNTVKYSPQGGTVKCIYIFLSVKPTNSIQNNALPEKGILRINYSKISPPWRTIPKYFKIIV